MPHLALSPPHSSLTLVSLLTLTSLSHPLVILYCGAGGPTLLLPLLISLTSLFHLLAIPHCTKICYGLPSPVLIYSSKPSLSFPASLLYYNKQGYTMLYAPASSCPLPQPYFPFHGYALQFPMYRGFFPKHHRLPALLFGVPSCYAHGLASVPAATHQHSCLASRNDSKES